MNRGITGIFVILMSMALSACINDYSGDVGGASAGGDGKVIGPVNENGRREYIAQCASCHGTDGNGTPAGSSLVGCATCTSQSVLADEISRTMPIANVNNCSGDCASDTAEYILQVFNDRILSGGTTSLEGVTNSPQATTLRRATLQMTGRMPTDAELALVNEKGDVGLSQALSSMMEEEAFYQSLMEVFNEQLLTDKYLSSNLFEGGINLLDNEDFPKRKWYNDEYSEDNESRMRSCVRTITNDAVAREPLELIRYLSKNGKPHTEFMTADYIMVNWYSQKVYEAELLDPDAKFRELDTPVCADPDRTSKSVSHDPNDFKPARIKKELEFENGGIPHSGILTSAMFLNRYPTTFTNRNRHRSKIVFDYFLDTDILQIQGDRPGDGIGNGKPNPTLLDPACYACHQVMDPVASAFQHWTERGQYIVTGSTSRNRWDNADIEPAGLGGKKVPLSGSTGYFRNMLQWLGKEIANDPRFIRATVRTLYKGIVGQDPLIAPGESASDADKQAFNSQRAILNAIGQAMVADGWNLKTAVKGVIMSPYYRASGVDSNTLSSNSHIGSSQFLSPEQLQRKLKATFGFVWDDLRWENNRLMLGGMDSDSITERIREPSGLMIAIQNRMAVEMACRGVPYDFTWHNSKRRLFPHVETSTQPVDTSGNPDQAGINAIKHNIQHLHWRLTGESLPLNHAEIEASFQLFMDVFNQGQQLLENNQDYNPRPQYLVCRAERDFRDDGRFGDRFAHGDEIDEVKIPPEQQRTRIREDDNYVIRSWIAVVTYLLSDYRFIYQ
ncbi:hypothetical protein [Bacterioplanoides sp.]|uniref:hypothetical protein n=1 Tax=Bacterioplanoides sp. TaxID=2066072 RepID=UPI003B5A7AC9